MENAPYSQRSGTLTHSPHDPESPTAQATIPELAYLGCTAVTVSPAPLNITPPPLTSHHTHRIDYGGKEREMPETARGERKGEKGCRTAVVWDEVM